MRVRKAVLGVVVALCGAISTTGCAALSGDNLMKESVANVASYSQMPISQALAKEGYLPVIALSRKVNHRTEHGVIYLVCAGKYQNRVEQCAKDMPQVVNNEHPGVVVMNGKIFALIGGGASHTNEHFRLITNVPATPVDEATFRPISPVSTDHSGVITWQDATQLPNAAGAVHYLVTSVAPEASRLCGKERSAQVLLTQLGQTLVSYGDPTEL